MKKFILFFFLFSLDRRTYRETYTQIDPYERLMYLQKVYVFLVEDVPNQKNHTLYKPNAVPPRN